MDKYVASNGLPQNDYRGLITSTLSSYEVKEILSDGKIKTYKVEDDYFLVNDVWDVHTVGQIPNFVEQYKDFKGKGYRNAELKFSSDNPAILELKFVFYHKLFNDEWHLNSAFNVYRTRLNQLIEFLNEKHSRLPSLLDLDINKAEKEWIWWLTNKGRITTREIVGYSYGVKISEYSKPVIKQRI